MQKALYQTKNILLTAGLSLSLLCLYGCSDRKVTDENSMSKPDPTGSLSDTTMDAIDPKINPAGAAEDSLSGKINGSTSGNNTGRTE